MAVNLRPSCRILALLDPARQKNCFIYKSPGACATHIITKHMLKNYIHDRMSGGKAAKRSNSGVKADERNHAVVSLTPKEDDSSRWVSTLAPLTLLKTVSKHVFIIDKGPNKGLLFESNTGSNLGHPVGF